MNRTWLILVFLVGMLVFSCFSFVYAGGFFLDIGEGDIGVDTPDLRSTSSYKGFVGFDIITGNNILNDVLVWIGLKEKGSVGFVGPSSFGGGTASYEGKEKESIDYSDENNVGPSVDGGTSDSGDVSGVVDFEDGGSFDGGSEMCQGLIYKGEPSKKLNFVFISDGFVKKEDFLRKVEEFVSLNNPEDKLSFLNYYPYSEFRDYFNIFPFYNPEIDWGCDSVVNYIPFSHPLCADGPKVLDKLAEFCDWGLEADYLIFLSNKEYRSHATAVSPEELEKVKILAISTLSGDFVIRKKVFLHELGHALGELSDEYVDIEKGQYKPEAMIGARNIDPEGCPSWCSGSLDKSNMFYESYANYVDCTVNLNVDDPDDNPDFMACFNARFYPTAMNNCLNQAGTINNLTITQCYETLYNSNIPPQVGDMCYNEHGRFLCKSVAAYQVDLGTGCIQGTGCYWPAGGMNGFRSIEESLMINPDQVGVPFLGPYNEKLVIESINRRIQERQIRINQIKLNILELSNSSFPIWWINEIDDLQIPFKVIFKTLNRDNQAVIINNNFRNYITQTDDGIINKNLATGNLELYFTYGLDGKVGQTQINPGDFKDIEFHVRYNDIEVRKTYRFYLFNLTFIDLEDGDGGEGDDECSLLGDVNHNGKLEKQDSDWILEMVVGKREVDMCGDVSENGGVTAYDASLVLRAIESSGGGDGDNEKTPPSVGSNLLKHKEESGKSLFFKIVDRLF
ncbi:MAG: M64 family metallopeptidase [Nanoarchaeota archaeon]|nr:M64 family metallopeptidase [Nanoarchaeota archaeon]